jgi:hypothetical protein
VARPSVSRTIAIRALDSVVREIATSGAVRQAPRLPGCRDLRSFDRVIIDTSSRASDIHRQNRWTLIHTCLGCCSRPSSIREESLRRCCEGAFSHDGRFATLQDVVDHYNTFLKLGLTTAETRDLIEYLKSL